jgi:predicted O-methyltransferase YrrM
MTNAIAPLWRLFPRVCSNRGEDRRSVNWLVQNFSRRLRYAVQNPRYALRSLYRELTLADERFLGRLTGAPARKIRRLLNEPIRTESFASCLRTAEENFQNLEIQSADLYAKKILVQYAAVRAFQPEIIVETGVANGVSSAYLLLALHLNKRGTLYSIELGDPQYLPVDKSPGWVVPAWLNSRWKLVIGDSRVLLPQLLMQIGPIDIFIHDSLHTYEHMIWEYRIAYRHLRPGGLLFSDDAAWNSAFGEFSREVAAPQAEVLRGVGFLRKGLA